MSYANGCYVSIPVALMVICDLLFSPASAVAQVKCTTTFDCAQKAAESAAEANAAATAMAARITKLEAQVAKLSTKYEFVVRRAYQPNNNNTPPRIGCDEANGESLIAGSCIGGLSPTGDGGGQYAVGPFLFGEGQWDIEHPIHTVECRSGGQSITALAVCMRAAKQ